MNACQSARPRVGLLALTLELYETLAPDLRGEREAWLKRDAVGALEKDVDVLFDKAVFRREDIDAQVAALEAQGADALLVVLLSYSPSQIALPALKRTRLPIIVWNTQELKAVDEDYGPAQLTANHGVHGTQDLCNVLVRSGVPFEYVTSHPTDPDATAELVDFFHAASAAARLRRARLGLLGYPFPGMGDFALDTTHMAATLGCEWANVSTREYAQRMKDADGDAVRQIMDDYRAQYDVGESVTDDGLETAARSEASLRSVVEELGLSAVTYQFLAFSEDKGLGPVPFVAVSRLMAEGVGFGGEGDLIASAGTMFLNALNPPASFTEIFTIDFAGNGLLMSHMGEANPVMGRTSGKVKLIAQPKPITGCAQQQLALLTTFEPGPATLCALTLADEQRWRFVVASVEIADFGPLAALQTPHCKLTPDGDVRDFLTAYAKFGGPHHSALCFGDARRRLMMAADLLDADYCEV